MKPKQTKADIQRKLTEALAGHAYLYAHAEEAIEKSSSDHFTGSGVILTLTALGGREIVPPVLIRDGLSPETIAALRADFLRSYELATLRKPKGKK